MLDNNPRNVPHSPASATSIPLGSIRYVRESWPREGLSEERCAIFEALYREGESLQPPIEVIAREDGTHRLCDGMHRVMAAKRAGRETIDAILISSLEGESAEDTAYRRGLETATTSSLPLTYRERQRASLRLLATRPQLSRREIARMVGTAHSTIDRWAKLAEREEDESDDDGDDTDYDPGPSVEDVVRRLARYVREIDDARSLLDVFKPERVGRPLSLALRHEFGDGAVARAKLLASWSQRALDDLRDGK
jgi:hypothetical protein